MSVSCDSIWVCGRLLFSIDIPGWLEFLPRLASRMYFEGYPMHILIRKIFSKFSCKFLTINRILVVRVMNPAGIKEKERKSAMEGLIWQEPCKSLGPKGVLVRCGDMVIGVIVHLPGRMGTPQQFQAWKPFNAVTAEQKFWGNHPTKLAALEAVKRGAGK